MPSVSKTKSKIVNPAQVDPKVVEAIQILQAQGFEVDSLREQITEDAIERINGGEDLIPNMDDRVQVENIKQCCPGFG